MSKGQYKPLQRYFNVGFKVLGIWQIVCSLAPPHWQPVKGAPCLSPEGSWDRLQHSPTATLHWVEVKMNGWIDQLQNFK